MTVTSIPDLYITLRGESDIFWFKQFLARRVTHEGDVSRTPFPCADAAIFDRGQTHFGNSPTYVDFCAFPSPEICAMQF